MASEVFQLYLLLTLKDYVSGGLNRVRADLRGTGKDAQAALRDFDSLRAGLKRDLGLAAVGVGTLMMLRRGVKEAGDFEQAMTELQLSIEEIDKATGAPNLTKLNDQMARSQALAVRLGNTLPGSTQDFIEMMAVLKQGGMQTERMLGGGGEAVANLAVVTHANPAELAKDYAQIGEMFQLQNQKEWTRAADISARLFRATGIRPEEQVQGLKFAQVRAGANLGLKGLEGYESLGRILGTLRTYGLEGGFGGRELSRFLMQLASFEKNAAKLKKTSGIDLHAKGIDLKFFDEKGTFAGFDNIFKQLEKLRVLSDQERIKVGEKVFTAEGTAIATAFMTAGEEGWKKINDRVDAIPPLQEQINQTTATWNTKLENVEGTLKNVTATGFMPLLKQVEPLADHTNTLLGSVQQLLANHPQMAAMGADFLVIFGTVMTLKGGIGAAQAAMRLLKIEAITTRGVLSSLSTPIKITIIATEILFIIEELKELKRLRDEVNQQNTNLAVRGQQNYQLTEKLKATPGVDPAQLHNLYVTTAQSALAALNKEGTLREQMHGGLGEIWNTFFQVSPKAKWWENIAHATGPGGPEMHPFYQAGQSWYSLHPERGAQIDLFKQRAPELKTSEAMAEFVKMVNSLRDWPEEAKQNLLKLAQESFPQSFKEAQESLVPFSDELKKSADSMLKLNAPLNLLPNQFQNAGSAAQRFSDRVDALDLTKGFGAPNATGTVNPSPTPTPKPGVSYLIPRAKNADGGVRGPSTEFHPDVARKIVAEFRSREPGVGSQIVHHHHDHRRIEIKINGAGDPRAIARALTHELELQMERA